MIYRKQLFKHKPQEGIFGDCHRTAIACLMDLEPEQVPHFGQHYNDPAAFHRECNDWLHSQGLATVDTVFQCSLKELLEFQQSMNPGAYYLLGGTSRSGCNHTVVCKGGEIIHDPSQSNSGIVGPCDDGFLWCTFIVHGRFVDQMYKVNFDSFYRTDALTD